MATPWEAARRTTRSNVRLVVDLADDPWLDDPSEARLHRLSSEVASKIRRHVDGVDSIVARWDTTHACPFCGLRWEPEPVCCDRAVALYDGEPAPAPDGAPTTEGGPPS